MSTKIDWSTLITVLIEGLSPKIPNQYVVIIYMIGNLTIFGWIGNPNPNMIGKWNLIKPFKITTKIGNPNPNKLVFIYPGHSIKAPILHQQKNTIKTLIEFTVHRHENEPSINHHWHDIPSGNLTL